MSEMRSFRNEQDQEIIRAFQEEFSEIIGKGGSEDLKNINPEHLGEDEMETYYLLNRLNDGDIAIEEFRANIDEKYKDKNLGKRKKSINHYNAWVRNQAMKSLMKKQ